MSITPKALRQLRIIAIPLTRPTTIQNSTKNALRSRILTYYQFQITSPPKPTPELANGESRPWWRPEGGVGNWITTKAAETWAGFGKAEGGWKLKTYQVGEQLVDRIDFEELALKGIDPSLGPTITHPGRNGAEVKSAHIEKIRASRLIPLVYPPSINTGPVTLGELQALLAYRTPRHRKGFFFWMLIAPLTAPFMIIPIIPNLPFFFCVWRSWSHYKAYRSSQYLQSLLDSDSIVPDASPSLDIVYKDYAVDKSPAESEAKPESEPKAESAPPPHHRVLLTRDAVPAILSLFGLKPTAGADLQRAVEQARVRVKSGRGTL
ncbi:mitochondrial K+-H+ exchange-related-domain-containing protein [Collybia nuda]|uniref:Mitochondrial K+-H+ exchange-related-domain-containing protein n=1 Tax=Collybia nuda TaxID=64659 RepID=A0A9P6CQ66_9AGAR|nr:mitochondrial K+-H+ exchange-related-domain-containing protein [Collybia nuda]